jgi:hypothetical protein
MGLFSIGSKDRRRHQRVPTPGTAAMFGDVMDLSESGACLFRKGNPGCAVGDDVDLDIRQGVTELHIRGKVVRIGELGFRRYEVGVEFQEIGPAEAAVIRLLQQPELCEQIGPRAYLAA